MKLISPTVYLLWKVFLKDPFKYHLAWFIHKRFSCKQAFTFYTLWIIKTIYYYFNLWEKYQNSSYYQNSLVFLSMLDRVLKLRVRWNCMFSQNDRFDLLRYFVTKHPLWSIDQNFYLALGMYNPPCQLAEASWILKLLWCVIVLGHSCFFFIRITGIS